MLDESQPRALWVIWISVLIACVLSVVPLPSWVDYARPEWVAIVLIFWAVAVPHRVGVVAAWTTGLFIDILEGDLLGQHALSLAVVVFITSVLHLRIRVFPVYQQCMIVMLLIGTHLLLNLIVQTFVSDHKVEMWYWAPTISTALLWPWVLLFLRGVSQRYYVN